jgi:anaerobic ribonucleoside-triphosphate reductase activating protein
VWLRNPDRHGDLRELESRGRPGRVHRLKPIRIASIVDVTEAEGPGRRFAVWVQGCSIRCEGCCNPQMFDHLGGTLVTPDLLLARLDKVRDQVEGVTLLGGEPFEQAAALLPFAEGVRARGKDVVAFSGHHLEELRLDRPPGARALLALVDLLVDGPYRAQVPETMRRWSGSANQCFHYLTDRIPHGVEEIRPGEIDRTVELRIGTDGRMERNGWPE